MRGDEEIEGGGDAGTPRRVDTGTGSRSMKNLVTVNNRIRAGVTNTCSAKNLESVSVEISFPPVNQARAVSPINGRPPTMPSATRVLKKARASQGREYPVAPEDRIKASSRILKI